jgi:predicted transcriptional regulator
MLCEDKVRGASPSRLAITDAASRVHPKEKIMDYKEAFTRMFKMPDFPRVRTTDPLTSFEAAEAIKPVVAQHHQIILDCLQTHGALGKDGIASLSGLDGNQVARRLNEMKVIGLIHLTGNTVKSNSGRNEREWSV